MTTSDPPSAEENPDSHWFEILAKHGRKKTFPARTIIIHEGDSSDLIYLIHEGGGTIYSTNEAGKMIVFDSFSPGDILGEPSLDGGTRSASVMTLEKTTCSVIRTIDFRQLISTDPSLAMNVIFKLIRLLRAANDNIRSLALDDVYRRVVRMLMQRAVPSGDHWVIEQRLTQQAIADHVGSSREMVNKVMMGLERGNYIAVNKNSIEILRKLPAEF